MERAPGGAAEGGNDDAEKETIARTAPPVSGFVRSGFGAEASRSARAAGTKANGKTAPVVRDWSGRQE